MAARLSCLDAELEEVRSFANLMASGESEVVQHAVEASSLLPRVGDCANVAALLSPAKVPDDPRLGKMVSQLRGELAEARALTSAGAYTRAQTKLVPLVESARATGYAPVRAEALLELGRAQVGLGSYSAAEDTLSQAEVSADEGHHDIVRGQAILERVEVTGRWLGHYPQAERDAERASSVARRVHRPELEWAALDAESRVHGYLGKLDQAVVEGKHSVELAIKLFGPTDLRVARAHGAISIALADLNRLDEAIREDQHALEISERALGSAHPQLVRLLTNVSTGLAWSGRYEAALPYARRAQGLAEKELGEYHSQHGLTWNMLGYIFVSMGQFREGFAANARALAIYEHQGGTDYVESVYPLVGMGEAELGLSEPEAALKILERAARIADAHDLDAETEGACYFHYGRALWLARHDRNKAVAMVQKAVLDFTPVPRLAPLKQRAEEWLRTQGADVR
jgi:tetratricopeptide (TPR) repeat protein